MAQIEITINGRGYAVACDDGQEEHVSRLGRYIDQKVGVLLKSVGQVGDARLLLLAGLIITDELLETDQTLSQVRQDAAAPARSSTDEAALARTLDELTDRIEAIADGLERD